MSDDKKIPARIRRAILHFRNAEFWCGAWQDEATDSASYEALELSRLSREGGRE